MKKAKRYAGAQESFVQLDDTGPTIDYGGGDSSSIDLGYTPERESFDKSINYAKDSMYINPDDNQMYSKTRGLGPSLNAARLEQRGIDVPALVGGRGDGSGRKKGGAIKKMASGGMASKVSSASKRADGIATKGKTKGRFV